MAEGKWVMVPGNLTQSGKPERRYQMKSGQYRETEPNSAEWYDQMYKQPVQNARSGLYDFFAAYDGDPGTNPGDLSRRQSPSSGLSAAERIGSGDLSEMYPLPYGGLPPSAANTPGFVVGQPVDPSTWTSGESQPPREPLLTTPTPGILL